MAILLTQAMDSDIVIRLINQVQIFRYANKPIRRGALQPSVKAAVTQKRHLSVQPRVAVAPYCRTGAGNRANGVASGLHPEQPARAP